MPGTVPPLPQMTGARHFNADELRQLVVLFDAIWPGGEDRPGAREAGAADYVDQLLALPATVYYEIPSWITRYKEGLPYLENVARGRFGKPLAVLSRDQATALLADLTKGALTGSMSAQNQKVLFGVLRGHCIEGCVADPRWGGNREKVIWNWLGYPDGDAAQGAPAVQGTSP
ncbi:Gluconate 2-dehydrogenase [Mesorhizobium sp. ORS 3324]|nr:Gluconate 2-dehydrogenase [Mesorhizobium sp. ORS 3324]